MGLALVSGHSVRYCLSGHSLGHHLGHRLGHCGLRISLGRACRAQRLSESFHLKVHCAVRHLLALTPLELRERGLWHSIVLFGLRGSVDHVNIRLFNRLKAA